MGNSSFCVSPAEDAPLHPCQMSQIREPLRLLSLNLLVNHWKSFLYIFKKAVRSKMNFFKQRFSRQETFNPYPFKAFFQITYNSILQCESATLLFSCFQSFPEMFPNLALRVLFKDVHLILLFPTGGFCCVRISNIVIILSYPLLSYKIRTKL